MKEIIVKSLKDLIADRYLTILLIGMIILAFWFAISIGLSIQPSERQLVSHYSAFGTTFFYSDQWMYLLVFVLFEIIAVCLHVVISIKMLEVKGHSLAVMFAWLGLAIIVLGWLTASKLLALQTVL
jgi:hypothetical protein